MHIIVQHNYKRHNVIILECKYITYYKIYSNAYHIIIIYIAYHIIYLLLFILCLILWMELLGLCSAVLLSSVSITIFIMKL